MSLLTQLRSNVSASSVKKSASSEKSESAYAKLIDFIKGEIAKSEDGLLIMTADDVVKHGVMKSASEWTDKRSGVRDYVANNFDLPIYPAENRMQAVKDLVGDGVLFVVCEELKGTDKERREERRAHFRALIGLSESESESADPESESADPESASAKSESADPGESESESADPGESESESAES